MSLFQCEKCGCVENTACSSRGYTLTDRYDRSEYPEGKDKMLCSVCGPKKYLDGTETGAGDWHNRFKRTFLPLGMFETNEVGNLSHKETKSEDYWPYEIKGEQNELE